MSDFNNIPERTTQVYKATIKDPDKEPIPLASLSTLTLTLYSVRTKAIINSRDAQDVLNDHNVTVHATSGLLTWTMQPADNAIVTGEEALQFAKHTALFEWTWGGDKEGRHEKEFTIRNLHKVP